MGQPIVVTSTSSSAHRGIVRYETNRALTGMGHESYRSLADVQGERPPDLVARRILERGGVDAVHVYDNMISVDLAKGATDDGIKELIEQLYIFYPQTTTEGPATAGPATEEPTPAGAPSVEAAPTDASTGVDG